MEETFEDTTRFTQAIVHNMLRHTLAENNYVISSSFSPFPYPSNLSAICPILHVAHPPLGSSYIVIKLAAATFVYDEIVATVTHTTSVYT